MRLDRQILKSHPLLALIPTFAIRKLVNDSSLSEYPKGTVVFREGEPCDGIYLIISGRCESRRSGEAGEVEELFGPGDMLGEHELLHQDPYRTTVRVATDSVLLRIDGDDLHRLLEQKPRLAGRISQSISSRLRQRHRDRPSHLRRIVSIVSLSRGLNDIAIARRLAQAVRSISGQRVLLARLMPGECLVRLSEWPGVTANGESFCYSQHLVEQEGGYSELRIQADGDPNSADSIAPMLSHFGIHFDYVLFHLAADLPAPISIEATFQADLSYVLLEPDEAAFYEFRLLTRQLAEQTKDGCAHLRPILYLKNDAPRDTFNQALRSAGHPVYDFARGHPLAGTTGMIDRPGNFPLHIRRLAREIARRRVGLALSSGGAKGLSHIGVIQILEENGIEVDVVAGSSMGAYVGAIWTFGHDGHALERIARELEGRWGLLRLVDPVLPPRRGFLRADRIVQRLRSSIGRAHFSDLVIPFRVIATHLDTLERCVFSTGDVADAVSASIAIPGICVPITLDNETFIDGGIADPLPVDVLREMGIENVIAVNTIPTPERLRFCLLEEREQQFGAAESRNTLNTRLNYFAHGNILDTMLRAIHGVQTRVAESACREADLVLRPLACDAAWHDFTNPRKYIALGRKVAEDQLAELKALANGGCHENASPVLLNA